MGTMSSLSNSSSWGFQPWSPEHSVYHGTSVIHPDDFERWVEQYPYGGVFECIGREDGYLVLSTGSSRFRVKPNLFKPIAKEVKPLGTQIVIESKGTSKNASIVDIRWHHQKGEPYYFVEVDGKRLSKRYFNADLK